MLLYFLYKTKSISKYYRIKLNSQTSEKRKFYEKIFRKFVSRGRFTFAYRISYRPSTKCLMFSSRQNLLWGN